jgi:hypothetical protein
MWQKCDSFEGFSGLELKARGLPVTAIQALTQYRANRIHHDPDAETEKVRRSEDQQLNSDNQDEHIRGGEAQQARSTHRHNAR